MTAFEVEPPEPAKDSSAPPVKDDPDGSESKPEAFAGEPVADPWDEGSNDGDLDTGSVSGNASE